MNPIEPGLTDPDFVFPTWKICRNVKLLETTRNRIVEYKQKDKSFISFTQ
jgi:hypothetical protein